MEYHIAQINVAKLKAPINDPSIHGFKSRLDEINAIAERSPGFVWRLKDDEMNNATTVSLFDDALMIVNVSVWETIEDLKAFTYRTEHVELFRDRAYWFQKLRQPHMALWWVKKNDEISGDDAILRLTFLRANGPSAEAFNFKNIFPPPKQ